MITKKVLTENLTEILYMPCPPCADSDLTAARGERIMMCHNRIGPNCYYLELFRACKGVIHAGYVIGYFSDNVFQYDSNASYIEKSKAEKEIERCGGSVY